MIITEEKNNNCQILAPYILIFLMFELIILIYIY